MSQTQNKQLVLISGESGTGKSVSLMNLPHHKRVMYLNCEAGKQLPFRNRFQDFVITDPLQVLEAFEHAAKSNDYDVIVIDTLTFLLDMYESQYVIPATNTQQAWGNFAQYFKLLMQEKIAAAPQAVIVLAHTRTDLDDSSAEMHTKVPVKGSLKNNGIEAYFSTVVSTKKMTLKELEPYSSDLLNITPDDEELGYKHVFQTRLTKSTKNERIRSPMGMFSREQTFMDNDAALLLHHLNQYYTGS